MELSIRVVTSNKTLPSCIIQIKPTDTVAIIKQKIIDDLKANHPDDCNAISVTDIRLKYGAGEMKLGLPISEYLDKQSQFRIEVNLASSELQTRSLNAAREVFTHATTESISNQKNLIVAVGCYDYNHGPESIARQQHPIYWLTEEQEQKGNTIVLIDKGFSDQGNDKAPAQCYHSAIWGGRPIEETEICEKYAHKNGKDTLYVIKENLPPKEWGLFVNADFGKLSILEVDCKNLCETFKKNDLIFLAGNFYDSHSIPIYDSRNPAFFSEQTYQQRSEFYTKNVARAVNTAMFFPSTDFDKSSYHHKKN